MDRANDMRDLGVNSLFVRRSWRLVKIGLQGGWCTPMARRYCTSIAYVTMYSQPFTHMIVIGFGLVWLLRC
jgi:hypothetical protein